MGKRLLVFFVFLILLSPVKGQLSQWGTVSPEEAAMKYCSFEPKAPAVILYDMATYTFEVIDPGLPNKVPAELLGELVTYHRDEINDLDDHYYYQHRNTRIKILRREGLSKSHIVLPFHGTNNREDIFGLHAQTINVKSDSTVEVIPVDISEIYRFEKPNGIVEIQFSFPNVEVGSILEMGYIKKAKNLLELEKWTFQNELPTVTSQLTLMVPPALHFEPVLRGKELESRYSNISDDVHVWHLENMPSLPQDNLVARAEDYREHLFFQPGVFEKVTWNDIAKAWKSDVVVAEFFNESKYTSYWEQSGDSSVTQGSPEALRALLTEGFKWDGSFYFLPNKSIDQALKDKKGNSAVMNLLLAGMLQAKGFTANPVLTSTRRNGLLDEKYPSYGQFNHLIIEVATDDGHSLVDATDTKKFGTGLPLYDYNELGLKVADEASEWLPITPPASNHCAFNGTIEIDFSGKVIAEMELGVSGLETGIHHEMTDAQMSGIFGKAYTIQDITAEWDESSADASKLHFELSHPIRAGENIENIKLSPWLLSSFQEPLLKKRNRTIPVDLIYPQQISYDVTLKIPVGYVVTSSPEPLNIQLSDQIGEFDYQLEMDTNKVQLKAQINIYNAHIPINRYHELKEFYEKVVARLNEPITFKQDSKAMISKVKMEEQ